MGSIASASDLTSTNFIIRDPVIGTGGGYASSGTFQMFQSLDDSVIGASSSATFLGRLGFLYFQTEEGVEEEPIDLGGSGARPPGLQLYCRIADFNCDTHVNIFDLSILLFYVEQSGREISLYDLSGDNEVGFTDISIVFYYWDEEI